MATRASKLTASERIAKDYLANNLQRDNRGAAPITVATYTSSRLGWQAAYNNPWYKERIYRYLDEAEAKGKVVRSRSAHAGVAWLPTSSSRDMAREYLRANAGRHKNGRVFLWSIESYVSFRLDYSFRLDDWQYDIDELCHHLDESAARVRHHVTSLQAKGRATKVPSHFYTDTWLPRPLAA